MQGVFGGVVSMKTRDSQLKSKRDSGCKSGMLGSNLFKQCSGSTLVTFLVHESAEFARSCRLATTSGTIYLSLMIL